MEREGMTTSVLTRLHISPLNPDLLPIVLGSSLANSAENISYQTIATFPENNYGFLELPSPDAKRLMSKLNGAILKGRKMKVEEARPKKRRHEDIEAEVNTTSEKEKTTPMKFRTEDNVLEGHELPEGRKVKRGWTEPKSKRSTDKKVKEKKKTKLQAPSKYTEKEELLFHTKIPTNKTDLDTSKKGKEKKKKKGSKNDTVHEFEKTTKQPSFLRDTASTSNAAAEYIDGVGWVNEAGEMVEAEPANVKRRKEKKPNNLTIDITKTRKPKKIAESIQPQTSLSSSEDTDRHEVVADAEETSSAGTTSSSEEVEDEPGPINSGSTGLGLFTKDSSVSPPQAQVQEAPNTPPAVHPLEALFKKPRLPAGQDSTKPVLDIETSFSFFGQDALEDEDEVPRMPTTPFTSQDLNVRSIRSAAPTPDTAHPSRFTSFAAALESRTREQATTDEFDDEEVTTPPNITPSTVNEKGKEQNEFEKRFWAERGQNNRAWKARRRTAMKEERQKENRLRRSRNR